MWCSGKKLEVASDLNASLLAWGSLGTRMAPAQRLSDIVPLNREVLETTHLVEVEIESFRTE